MTETLQETLDTLERVAESVSRENPEVDEQFRRAERAAERLGEIAHSAGGSAA